MPFLSPSQRSFLQAVCGLAYCNQFLPERIEYERAALGLEFHEVEPIWSFRVDDPDRPHINAERIRHRLEQLIPTLRERLAAGASPSAQDLTLYQDATVYLLYYRCVDALHSAMVSALDRRRGSRRFTVYRTYRDDWDHFLEIPGIRWPTRLEAPHVFACFFQIQRAFYHIHHNIIGSSLVGARLRAAVWQSIFTHDVRRYRDVLYTHMHDATTLVTGPSGTGKELVARAIGRSGYIPFDPKAETFAEDFIASFHALNLSAMPATLIESELFGHKRGAFTGAVSDRRGWLEICTPGGAVFLDEIGDLEPAIQVKLLRVLQTRTFQPVGETTERQFHGKIIAATNRDLAQGMREGNIREDFYYRLCSDVIVTPSLHELLRESPEVLGELLLFIARRVVGEHAETVAKEVEEWIVEHLGLEYPWPGNIRELEQCVRSVLIRKEYQPARPRERSTRDELASAIDSGTLTADELLQRYCTLTYARTGNYQETARRLQLDRRTVKAKIDRELLAQLRDLG